VRGRAERARSAFDRANVNGEVVFTAHAGHGRELAAAFVKRGFSPVIAWGGDGTVNEIASAVAFHDAALGIVPAGSGNGLARELGISRDADLALESAIVGHDRSIDVGELGGRLFINVAGIGLDASVASRFNRLPGRGLLRYVWAMIAEVFGYIPESYTITTDGQIRQRRALIVALANGRQYGNGALLAPHAKLDDGLLDLVVVGPLGPLRMLWGVGRLFTGKIDRVPAVEIWTAGHVTISATKSIQFHVDGEPVQGAESLTAVVHPGALRIRVPSP
jgi:YegS/Rv2252/BmrU family lipid kinase